jgi:hypothetical protein
MACIGTDLPFLPGLTVRSVQILLPYMRGTRITHSLQITTVQMLSKIGIPDANLEDQLIMQRLFGFSILDYLNVCPYEVFSVITMLFLRTVVGEEGNNIIQ